VPIRTPKDAVPPRHGTAEIKEHLARLSPWGDDGLPPIAPPWRRQRRVPSRLDGAMLTRVEPLSDAQLIWLARCLEPGEKARLDQIWKRERLDPVQPAIDAIAKLDDAPKRFLKRKGTHRTQLGDDPLEMLFTKILIHRLFDLALEALASLPEPKRRYANQVADHILAGLAVPHIFDKGPLANHIRMPLNMVIVHLLRTRSPKQRQALLESAGKRIPSLFRRATRSALYKEYRKDRSRAFWITSEIWSSIGEWLPERSLRRVLASRPHFRLLPDLIHPQTS
jgi:hypothetical protein